VINSSRKLLTTTVLSLGLLAILLAGCGATSATFEHQIQVEAADTGNPIANATVRAEMGVRDFVEATTNAEGVARLPISTDYLDRWAKVIVNADGYQRTSTLVELVTEKPQTVVQLVPQTQNGSEETQPAGDVDATPAVVLSTDTAADNANLSQPEAATNAVAAPENNSIPPAGQLPPAQRNNYYPSKPELIIDTGQNYRATIQTNKGDIVVSLNAEAAPEHANNFIFLSEEGFYNGLTFHRVEPNFVIQGGDPQGNGQGGPGYTIPGEFELKHVEGALAMARLPDQVNPNRESSGSQFYITLAPTPQLDGQYSVFGRVEEGMDVVKSIEVGDVIEGITIEPQ